MIDLPHLTWQQQVDIWLAEDVGNGDHSSRSAVPANAQKKARLLVKAEGIIAGIELAKFIFKYVDDTAEIDVRITDGSSVKYGDVAFYVEGNAQKLLTAERLVLNLMQRMSGIATKTNKLVKLIQGTNAKLLDTRKTTPGLRHIEKWAVRIGGGHNHRMGLYDMIMLKDNHNDYCGGITASVNQTKAYIKQNQLTIPIEVEVRNNDELKETLGLGGIQRVMLDNYTPQQITEALKVIEQSGITIETEASGGITRETLRAYAETGVDYISIGALTHSYMSLDMSLKAV